MGISEVQAVLAEVERLLNEEELHIQELTARFVARATHLLGRPLDGSNPEVVAPRPAATLALQITEKLQILISRLEKGANEPICVVVGASSDSPTGDSARKKLFSGKRTHLNRGGWPPQTLLGVGSFGVQGLIPRVAGKDPAQRCAQGSRPTGVGRWVRLPRVRAPVVAGWSCH